MKKRILIVDDEADLRDLLMYQLDDREMEFFVAGNCAEAMELAVRVSPDLILLDLLLPDVDGLTLCEGLKSLPATREVPIALMSAHSSDATRQLAQAAGAVEFFAKPFNLATFRARVWQLLCVAQSPQAATSAAA